MSLNCDIQLDNQRGIYQPGEVISGRVVLTLRERQLIKALSLKISGYASTFWEKPSKEQKKKSDNKHKENKHSHDKEGNVEGGKKAKCKPQENYFNREDYLMTINYFIGSEDALAKIIEPGVLFYSFCVRLPNDCPSSFEGDLGHIRYSLDVIIDYAETRHHDICSRMISVVRAIDLRGDLTLERPFELEALEKKSICKFWRRPMQLYVDLPQRGYVPGEAISVHAKIINYDHLDLTDITYKLNRISTYTGLHKKHQKVCVERACLVRMIHALFTQNSSIVQHLQLLHVPPTAPSTTSDECRCIQVEYEVEVLVHTKHKKRMLGAQLPIKIGTISLKNGIAQMPRELMASAPSLTASRTLDDQRPSVSSLGNCGASAPPISPERENVNISASIGSLASCFREADFMTSKDLNKDGKRSLPGNQTGFKPKYLYYDVEGNMPVVEGPSTSTAQAKAEESERSRQ